MNFIESLKYPTRVKMAVLPIYTYKDAGFVHSSEKKGPTRSYLKKNENNMPKREQYPGRQHSIVRLDFTVPITFSITRYSTIYER